MKFKVGDRVSYYGRHDRLRGKNHVITSVSNDGFVRVLLFNGWYNSLDFRLMEEQKMQNKNELKIGCHILCKQSDGGLGVFTSDGSPVYCVRPESCDDLKVFLSTPYQEDEVYIKAGDRLRNKRYAFNALVVRFKDRFLFVDTVTGVVVKDSDYSPLTPDALVPLIRVVDDPSEWEVIK